MLNGVSGASYYRNPYGMSLYGLQPAHGTTAVRRAAVPAAQLESPVQPVTQVPAVPSGTAPDKAGLLLRLENDPSALAVRSRIRYDDGETEGAEWESAPQEDGFGAERVQEAMEEGECQTCERRKYQDGSDDPGVSFKTAAHIAPEQAASVVRGHEMEHVVREQAQARQEDRRVVSQSVTYHTAICPECGRVYVSGGTTRTATAARQEQPISENQQESGGFSAVA